MREQKPHRKARQFWDSTAHWRVSYFTDLASSDPERLSIPLRLERDFVLAEELVVAEEVEAASTVLELGCGVGRSILPLISRFPAKRFVGVDYAPRQIGLFASALERWQLRNGSALLGDVSRVPLATESLDLVLVCNQTFGTFLGPTRTEVLSETMRLLACGGRFYVGGFTKVAAAAACYDAWNVSVDRIDYETGFIELESYNSWWEPEGRVNALLALHGFALARSVHVGLGFLNVYVKGEERASGN